MAGHIRLVEEPAANQWNAERLEIVATGAHAADFGQVAWWCRVPFGHEVACPGVLEGQSGRRAYLLDTGRGAKPGEHAVVELIDGGDRIVLVAVHDELRSEDVAGAEAHTDALERVEAADQQAGADEHHHSERHLCDHEDPPDTGAACGTASAALKRLVQLGP